MTLYDTYRTKVEKIGKVKKKIHKFRFLIIGLSVIILAAIAGCLASIGWISKNVTLTSNHFVYGEPIAFEEANVLIGNASYEYSVKDSNIWTSDVPTHPGEYYMRAKTKRVFGITSYSNPVAFAIGTKSLDLIVQDDQIIYGNDPTICDVALVEGDKISDISYKYEDLSLQITNVKVDSILIQNEQGEDVTAFYQFNKHLKSISILKRDIILTPIVTDSIYAGKPISTEYELSAESLNQLAENDKISYSIQFSDTNSTELSAPPINCGNYQCKIVPESIRIMNGSSNRTSHYNFIINPVSFSIEKYDITVTTPNATKEYDGTALSKVDGCSVVADFSLLPTHSLGVDSSHVSTITDVSQIKNILNILILDENGNDVSQNYNITYEYGTLSVTKRRIEVTPLPLDDKIYDGISLTYGKDYQKLSKEMPEGESLEIAILFKNSQGTLSDTIVHADTYDMQLASYTILNGKNENYDISLVSETVKILPRVLHLKPINFENKIYDGITYEYSRDYQNYEYAQAATEVNKVLAGEGISVSVEFIGDNGYTEANHAGTYTMSITDFEVNGLTTIKTDYVLGECENQSFTISPRTLKLKPINFENKIYDGITYEYLMDYQNFEYQEAALDENKVVSGDQIKVSTHILSNTYGYTEANHADTYTITISGFDVNEETTLLTDYELDICETQSFTIAARPISIIPTYHEVVYAKNKFIYDIEDNNFTYYDSLYELVDQEIITISVDTYLNEELVEAIHANTYALKINQIDYKQALETDYEITTQDGQLWIRPRTLKLKPTHFENKIYDGTAYIYSSDYQNFEYQDSALEENKVLSGEQIKVSVDVTGNNYGYQEAKHADTYRIAITGFDVHEPTTLRTDYELGVSETESFTISPRILRLKPIHFEDKVYDGNSYEYSREYQNFEYQETATEENKVVAGEEVRVLVQIFMGSRDVCVNEARHAATYIISIIDFEVNTSNTIKTDYMFADVHDNFTIFPRTLKLKPTHFEDKIYDGIAYIYSTDYQNFDYQDTALEENKVVTGEQIKVSVTIRSNTHDFEMMYHADTYTISIADFEVDGTTTIKTDYVLGECETENFTISPRTLKLKPINFADKIYDGIAYEYSKYDQNFEYHETALEENRLVDGEYISVVVTITSSTYDYQEAKHADTYTIAIYDFKEDWLTTTKTDYVLGECETVKFTISPRTLKLKPTHFADKIYDGIAYEYSTNYQNFEYQSSALEENKVVNGEEVKVSINMIGTTYGYQEAKHADAYTISITNFEVNETTTLVTDYLLGVCETESFTITPRPISIMPIYQEVVYAKTKFEYEVLDNNFTYYNFLYQMVDQEILTISVDTYLNGELVEAIHANTYTLRINQIKYKQALESDYDITTYDNQLWIRPRTLLLKPILFEDKIYDGIAYEYSTDFGNYKYSEKALEENKVVSGEQIKVLVDIIGNNYGYTEALHADTYTISITDFEVDATTTVKTDYVLGICEYEIFTISPRTLLLKPINFADKIYDGIGYKYSEDFANYEYSDTALEENQVVTGEQTKVVVSIIGNTYGYTDAKHADTYTISITDFEVDTTTTIKTDYVLGVCETQSFTISPRILKLRPINFADKIYDGIGYKYSEDFGNYEYLETVVEENQVVTGEQIKVVVSIIGNTYGYTDAKHADTYTISITDFEVDSATTFKRDYILGECETQSFTISSRTLLLKPINFVDKIYDGITYEYPAAYHNFEYRDSALVENKVVEGDEVKVLVSVAGNTCGYTEAKHADAYTITITDFEVNNVSTCKPDYLLGLCETQSFTISPRPISMMPIYSEVIYDSTAFKYGIEDNNFDYYNITSNQIVDQEIITISVDTYFNNELVEAVHANTYTLRINQINFKKALETDYDITTYDGQLRILPRTLLLKPNQFEDKIYDGIAYEYSSDYQNFEYQESALEENKVVLGEQIKVLVNIIGNNYGYTEAKHADTYTISITDFEVDGATTVKTDYALGECETENFTISIRTLLVDPINFADKVYDGIAYKYSEDFGNYEYLESALEENKVVPGERIKLFVSIFGKTYGYIEAKHADTYGISFYDFEVDELTTVKTDYTISQYGTSFTIYPRTLKLRPINFANKTYDGITYEYSTAYQNYEYLDSALEDNKVLTGEQVKILTAFAGNEYGYNEATHADTYTISITDFEVDPLTTIKTDYILGECEIVNFTISPTHLDIQLIPFSEECVYNGKPHLYLDEYSNFITDDPIYNDDAIKIMVKYFDELGNEVTPVEVGRYRIEYDSHICNPGQSSDYLITQIEAYYFEIVEKKIYITTQDVENKIYDGLTVSYDVTENNFVEVSKNFDFVSPIMSIKAVFINIVTGEETEEISHAGEYAVAIKEVLFTNQEDAEKYHIVYPTKIEEMKHTIIEKRSISITPNTFSQYYNGKEYTYSVETGNFKYTTDSAYQMVVGEQLMIEAAVVEGSAKNHGVYTLQITNVQAGETTSLEDYNVNTEQTSSLTILKRDVTIIPAIPKDAGKEYDGAIITYDSSYGNYAYPMNTKEENQFVLGEEIIITVDTYYHDILINEVKNAGSYKLSISGHLDEHAILNNYNLSYGDDITFTIEKAKVTISPSATCVSGDGYYDGTKKTYSIEEGNYIASVMIPNEYFTVTPTIYLSGMESDILHAAEYQICLTEASIKPSVGVLLSNYDFTFEDLYYRLSPRKVEIELLPVADAVYSGAFYSYLDAYDNYNLIGTNDILAIDGRMKVTATINGENNILLNAGVYEVAYKDYELEVGLKSDYEITCNSNVTFTISKKDISITLLSLDSAVYNGQEQYNYPSHYGNYEAVDGLIDGDKLTIGVSYSATPIDVATYKYSINPDISQVVNDQSGFTFSLNYNVVSCEEKEFEIQPASVHIDLNHMSMIFNKTYFDGNIDYQITEGNLFNSDTFEVIATSYHMNHLDGEVVTEAINVGTYYYKDTTIQFIEGKLKNYTITIDHSSYLEITPLELEVVLESVKESYDSANHSISVSKIETGFMPGDGLQAITYQYYDSNHQKVEPKDVGIYEVMIDQYEFFGSSLENYQLTFKNGKIEIIPAVVNFEIEPIEDKIYDEQAIEVPIAYGNYLSCDWTFTDSRFALEISFKYADYNNVQHETKQAVDAYTYQIILSLNAVEKDKVSNFDCRLSSKCNSEFVIQPRSITINTGSNESDIIYDGLSHSEVNHITIADSSLYQLIPGHEISYIDPAFSVVDAGEYSNKIDCIILKGEKDVSYNYDIRYIYGTITILPRPIHLQSYGMIETYTGYDVINNNYSILDGSLVTYNSDGVTISHNIIASRNYDKYGKYINVGIYQNVLEYLIFDEISRENVTKNYLITTTCQNIEIQPQELVVTYSNVVQTYIPGVNFSLNIEFQNLSLADTLEMVLYIQDSDNQILYDEDGNYCTSVKDVGNYLVTIENLIINGVNFEDQNNYTFDFSKNQSPLTINKSEDLIFDVYTKSHTFTLNGSKQSYPNIDSLNFPNENFSYGIDDSSITYIQYEASKVNKLAIIIYYNGQDITKNTTIIYHYGTLYMDNEVFVLSPKTMKYDGTSISTSFYEASVFSNLTNYVVQGITAKITYGLTQNGVDVIGHDAGIYDLKILGYQIYNNETKEDITDKLVLVKTEGLQLEITRRKMYIRPIYKDGILYDGTTLAYQPDEFEYFSYVDYYSTNMTEIKSDTLVESDQYLLNITASDSLSAPGKIKPYISAIQLYDENNNLLIPIVENSGSAIYTNYEIIYHQEEDNIKNKKQFYGFLQIMERTIEVTTYGGSKVYDGQPLYVNRYDYHAGVFDGLLPGDTLVLKENSFSVTRVTTAPKLNKLRFDVQHADGTIESANKYYNIIYTTGEESFLTILPKHIVIETKSLSVNWNDSYSTSPLTCHELVNNIELVEGDTLDMIWTGSINSVGSTKNTIDENSVVIKNASGSNVTENYEIEFKYGTLEIKSGS